MIGDIEKRNLETLLRLAAAEADALKSDLQDMSGARASAVRSLEAIALEPDAEGEGADRLRGRRRGLIMTLEVLARAEERAVKKLANVRAEAAKLRALMKGAAFAEAGQDTLRRAS
ncbi:MAG: hypothetical protein R3C58_11215 [Parvularculaceae bacterium]